MAWEIAKRLALDLERRLPVLRHAPYHEDSEGSLADRFIPEKYARKLTEVVQRQSLLYRYVLEQIDPSFFWREGPSQLPLPVLDVGSQDFSYAWGLATFLEERWGPIDLTALEAHTQAIYGNLYRRYDAATYRAGVTERFLRESGPSRVAYREGDWLREPPGARWEIITSFFPWLFADQHRRSPLSRQLFDPPRFYAKLIEASPRVVFFHQGLDEAREGLHLLAAWQDRGEARIAAWVTDNPWQKRRFPIVAVTWRRF